MNGVAAKAFKAAINEGLRTGKWKRIERWIEEHSSFSFDYEEAPEGCDVDEDVLGCVASLLENPVFLNARRSSSVMSILKYDWSCISDHWRRSLFPKLVAAYPRFKDRLAQFIVIELLGKFYCDERAYSALNQLSSAPRAGLRAFVPMGLGYIARRARPSNLRARAVARLEEMRKDRSSAVRDEVEIALHHIRRESDLGD